MKVSITQNGPIYTFHYTNSLMEKIGRLTITAMIAGMGLMILIASFVFLEEFIVFIVLFATGLILTLFGVLIWLFSGLKDITIDQEKRTFTKGYDVTTIPDSSIVVLDRKYDIVGGGRNRRKVVAWKISIKYKEGNLQRIYDYMGNGDVFNCPWIDETAETIAELLQITLEDNSGHQTEVRNPGETDTPYVELLKQRGVEIEDSQPSIPLELQDRLVMNFTDSGYELSSEYMPFSIVSIIKAISGFIAIGLGILFNLFIVIFANEIISLAFYEYDDSLELMDPIMVIVMSICIASVLVLTYGLINFSTFYLGIVLLTKLKRTTIISFNRVDINKKEISLKEEGLYLTSDRGSIPLETVEKLITVEKWKGKYSVEVVGDSKRLQLPGEYNLEEAGLLEKLITHLLVQMGI